MTSTVGEPFGAAQQRDESSGGPSDVVRWFDSLAEFSPAGIGVICVHENRYVRTNPALLELYGLTRDQVFGSDPFSIALQLSHPDDLVAEQKLFAELAVGARNFYRMEKRIVRPDGSIRWTLTTLTGGFDAHGEPRALSWVTLHMIDITEQRQLADTLERREAEFRHAQKVDALGRLTAGIAHDFNNLLTVIMGHAEVLERLTEAPGHRSAEARDDLAAIVAAAQRAAGLTAQLLAHGRRERATPRAFSLSELAGTLKALFMRTLGPNAELEFVLSAKGAILADRGQIGQVVMNLVLNARDALEEDGRIRIETRDVFVADEAGAPGPGEWVALIVADNGHGITPEVQAHMFEPFFTTRADRPGVQGNGLGLATVQRIVSDARGQIAVKSALHQGTTITVFFPRVEAAAELAPSELPSRPSPTLNTRRILVIEDEPAVRSLVGTVLLGAHYLVLVARDGAEGLAMLKSTRQPIHLIITDLLMPDIGGFSLARQLRESGVQTRILFISGYSEHTLAELSSYGAFLPKPFTPAELLAAVARALGDAT